MGPEGIHEPRNWKVKKSDGSRLEPANLDVLRQWVASRQIEPDDLVINDDLADWIQASEALELFDLFEKRPERKPTPRESPTLRQKKGQDDEIEVPDCFFHPGRRGAYICVGCGKFVCEECRERLEGKVYCRMCSAEKRVGAEPGSPAGPGAPAQIITGVEPASQISRFAIASLVFAIVAVISSFLMIIPRFAVATAPAAGFVAFIAALLGAVALNNIRLRGGIAGGRAMAITSVVAGLLVIVVSLIVLAGYTKRMQSAAADRPDQSNAGRRAGIVPSRRQPPADFSQEEKEERETNARQLVEKVTEYLNSGDLEQAVSTSKTVLGLYPDTQAAKIIEERLPMLEQALAAAQAEAEETRRQNEELAQARFDHAMKMYSQGNQTTALDLLKSIVESYPQTKTAEQAQAEVNKIEKAVADENLRKRDAEAAKLARQAEELLESEKYDEAVAAYRQVTISYPDTPTAASIRVKLKQAELLASDPSEREFRRIEKNLPQSTYEEAIRQLQDFLTGHMGSDRLEEAKELLSANQTNKSIADSLYNFGRTYLEEKKYNLALGRYEKLINEHPRSRWIPQAKKDYEEALEKLQE